MHKQLLEKWNPLAERCGFVLADGSVVECENVDQDRQNFFEISTDSIRQYEDRVQATWHTHPTTGPNLSAEDYKAFLSYPKWFHYIISETEVWCFYVRNNAVLLLDEDDLSAWLPEGAASGADQGPRPDGS